MFNIRRLTGTDEQFQHDIQGTEIQLKPASSVERGSYCSTHTTGPFAEAQLLAELVEKFCFPLWQSVSLYKVKLIKAPSGLCGRRAE